MADVLNALNSHSKSKELDKNIYGQRDEVLHTWTAGQFYPNNFYVIAGLHTHRIWSTPFRLVVT